jgi:hypothetical protein
MSQVEIRVRPVIRHVVTRFTPASEGQSAVETLGEFDSENYAEQVAETLRQAIPKPKQYAIVERTVGEIGARVWYAEEREEAESHQRQLEEHFGREFRIFEREVTDPIVLGRMSATRAGQWRPLDLQT